MHRSLTLSFALVLACACSSSGSGESAGDASACDGSNCGTQGDGASGVESGDVMPMPSGPDLCPRSGLVVPPLPTGISIVYDLKQSTDTIDDFLVTDSVLVWKDQKKVVRVNLSDGATATVVDHSSGRLQDQVGPIANDSTYVYFSDSVDPFGSTPSLGIARYPLSGAGSPMTVVNDPNGGLLAIAGGYLYYEHIVTTGTFQSEIARVPITGGTPTTLVRGIINGVRGLAVGGGYVYFFGTIGGFSYSSYYLARVPVTAQAPALPDGGVTADGGADASAGVDASAGGAMDAGVQPAGSELVATTGFNISGPATDSTSVYWGSDDTLMTVPFAGGTPTMLAQADPITGLFAMTANVYGIVPRGGSVYWSSDGCQGIRKTPSTGGKSTIVVPNVSAGLRLNSMHVYFAPTTTQVLSGPL
jgi:hypothetical protein